MLCLRKQCHGLSFRTGEVLDQHTPGRMAAAGDRHGWCLKNEYCLKDRDEGPWSALGEKAEH